MHSKRHLLPFTLMALMLTGCFEAVVHSTIDMVPDYSAKGYFTLATGDTIQIVKTSVSHQIVIDSNSVRDTVSTSKSNESSQAIVGGVVNDEVGLVCLQLLRALVGTYSGYGYDRQGFTSTPNQVVYAGTVILDRNWNEGESHVDSIYDRTFQRYWGVAKAELIRKDADILLGGVTRRVDVFRRSYESHTYNNHDTTSRVIYVERGNMAVLVEEHIEPIWLELPYKYGTVKDTRYELTIKRLRIN